MSLELVLGKLDENSQVTLKAIYNHACKCLDHTPRFKFYTLHGKAHLDSLFKIFHLLLDSGLSLKEREIFLLGAAICTHDLGMVVPLREKTLDELSQGVPPNSDIVHYENFIRDIHHLVIGDYVSLNFGFLSGIGLPPTDMATIAEIGKCHRKIRLSEQHGVVKRLGSLLRLIDELDIGPERAPITVLEQMYSELDQVAKWHWHKHAITDPWMKDHNVIISKPGGHLKIEFLVSVRPNSESAIDYWMSQAVRPLVKALDDEGVKEILLDEFSLSVSVRKSRGTSSHLNYGGLMERLESDVTTLGRKVILVIDDEAKRIKNSFFKLAQKYYVHIVTHPEAGFQYLDAVPVDLAIIDLQLGGGSLWNESETSGYRKTGFKIAEEIRQRRPETIVGFLTGTRHEITKEERELGAFFLAKPIQATVLEREISKFFKD